MSIYEQVNVRPILAFFRRLGGPKWGLMALTDEQKKSTKWTLIVRWEANSWWWRRDKLLSRKPTIYQIRLDRTNSNELRMRRNSECEEIEGTQTKSSELRRTWAKINELERNQTKVNETIWTQLASMGAMCQTKCCVAHAQIDINRYK